MRKHITRLLGARGDTLIEVMIAVTIVSTVLIGAFIVTQKSTLAVRNSQEHAEMAQILQGQVEQVRALSFTETNDSTGVYRTIPKYFCIATNGAGVAQRVDFAANGAVGDIATYPAQCRDIQTYYAVAITYDSTTDIFTFVGSWDRLGGGMNSEQFSYRISPGAEVFAPTPAASGSGSAVNAAANSVPGWGSGTPCYVLNGWTDPDCWNIRFINNSQNSGVTLDKCVWDWGNGTTSTYAATDQACQSGQTVDHLYTPVGSGPPQLQYTATVTNYSAAGPVKISGGVDIVIPY